MPRGDQLSRQWRLLQLVDRPQSVTMPVATAELRCTTRTIRRDRLPLSPSGAADHRRGIAAVIAHRSP